MGIPACCLAISPVPLHHAETLPVQPGWLPRLDKVITNHSMSPEADRYEAYIPGQEQGMDESGGINMPGRVVRRL